MSMNVMRWVKYAKQPLLWHPSVLHPSNLAQPSYPSETHNAGNRLHFTLLQDRLICLGVQ